MFLRPRLHLTDVGGAGPKSLLVANDVTPGLFPRSEIDGTWGPFTPFEQWPNAAFGDANLRQIDLNGDGEPDLVIARDDCFVWCARRPIVNAQIGAS